MTFSRMRYARARTGGRARFTTGQPRATPSTIKNNKGGKIAISQPIAEVDHMLDDASNLNEPSRLLGAGNVSKTWIANG
jgi:hypothetical protein